MRDILGVKQKQIVTQQAVSKLEQKDVIDEKILNKVTEALKNTMDEAAVNIIANNCHDNSASVNYSPTFNPIDKVIELYERMLKIEQEKVRFLQEALREKK